MTNDKKTLRNVTTATRQDASAEGKAGDAFRKACDTIAAAFKAAGIADRKGKLFAEVRAAAVKGWTSGKYPMKEAGAAQRWNRASRNALRINGDAEGWTSKAFPTACFESAGGRGLDKDWKPCAKKVVTAKGAKAGKPSAVTGGATGSPTPAPDTAGNVSEGRVPNSELVKGAASDATEMLAMLEGADTPEGNRLAALATSIIRKLELATGSQLS